MTTSRKLWIAGIVLTSAVSYLAYAGARQGWVYYVSVDQFIQDRQQQKHRVRLMGRVSAENLVVEPGKLQACFDLESKLHRLNVNYHGTIPDLFKAGADVVVEGKMNAAGTFEADVLLTKCASKYDPKHQESEKRL